MWAGSDDLTLCVVSGVAGIGWMGRSGTARAIRATAVFLTEHVAAMDDAKLENILAEQAGLDLNGGVTIILRETHTFVNFAFEAK